MSPANRIPKGVSRCQPDVRFIAGKLIASLMPLLVMLLSCRARDVGSQSSWNTYRNPRYNFEFPYPSNWVPVAMPDNRDGRAFRDPQNPKSEIRGWAANKLPEIEPSSSQNETSKSSDSQQPNFTTDQGVRGKLQVDVGADTSSMTLTLSQEKVQYNWQGQCESEQFADCYRLFYYIARQYRVPVPKREGLAPSP